MSQWQAISNQVEILTGQVFKIKQVSSVGGGCINSAYQIETDQDRYFIKLNRPELLPMFAAEASGLQEMAQTNTIRVPEVVTYGQTDKHSFLLLEYIEFGRLKSNSEQMLGLQLAQMHQQKQAYFGWHQDNTIGSTPQANGNYQDWQTFWQQQRLHWQLNLAADNGYHGRVQTKGERLCADLPKLFAGYQPKASLLHGDLWGGNISNDVQGNPVIYDPACYYGDHEADLAMTELFGGFGSAFYAAYQEVIPIDSGYSVRKTLYNLYHILNHLNLFGGGYLHQAEGMIDQLLAEI